MDYDPETFGAMPQTNIEVRPLSENDVRRIVADEISPLCDAVDTLNQSVQSLREDVYTKHQIHTFVDERNEMFESLKRKTAEDVSDLRKQVKDVLEGMNKWGKHVDDAIRGFTNQTATTQVRYAEVIDLNKATAKLAHDAIAIGEKAAAASELNSQTVSAWSGIVESIHSRADGAERKADTLLSRVNSVEDKQDDTEERMSRFVTVWEVTAENVKRYDAKTERLEQQQQTLAVQVAQSSAAIMQLQTTFSPRNVVGVLVVFATLIGVENGIIQQAIDNVRSLFGG